ncbi:MAG: metallophosphoesterase [Anaerovorax sp.]|nr:metallophosphoesterase [Anaerovorax sp.]
MKKRKMQCIIAAVIAMVFIMLAAFNTSLQITYYEVISSKVKETIRIAFIADLHSCNYGSGQIELIDAIIEQEPDILLFGGDIADDKLSTDNTRFVLESISNKYPCYYVSGNHEYWSGHIDEIKQMFREYGVTVLEGEAKTLELNEQKIDICGIDDPEAGNSVFFKQLEMCNDQVDDSNFTILLAHRPEYIETYLKYKFDLILSGHAHGGQWRLPGIVNGFYAPNQGWLPQYAGGNYKFGGKTFIVSRGLSRESTRIPRIFNRPELVIVNIKNAE